MRRTIIGIVAALSLLLVATPAQASPSGWGAKVGKAMVAVFQAILELQKKTREGHEERGRFTQDVAAQAWQELDGQANVLVFLEGERRQDNGRHDRHCDRQKSLSGDYDWQYGGSFPDGADFNDDDSGGTYAEFMDEKSSGSIYVKAMCYRIIVDDGGGDFWYKHDGGFINWAYLPARGTQATRHDGDGMLRVTFQDAPETGGEAPAHGRRVTLRSPAGEISGLTVWDKGGGYWEIEPTATGKVLEVVPGRWNVIYGAVNHGATQLWRFREVGDGRYQIVNRYNTEHGYPGGGCLTVSDGGSLWALDCNQPAKQTWTLT
ncbi:MAG: RICIN domain-containing protein [Nonomuraea sp.]|nr:RICIN domain-containing protein [Nonomuraea sp.]